MPMISYFYAPTSILASNSNWDNFDDYADYINHLIAKNVNVSDLTVRDSFTSQIFGNLRIGINVQEYLDYKGNTTIIFFFSSDDDNFTEDFFIDNLPNDTALLNFIETKYTELINAVNDAISFVQYPINENLIFKDEHLYMEISPLNSKHTPEFVSLQVDTEFYQTDVIDHIYEER